MSSKKRKSRVVVVLLWWYSGGGGGGGSRVSIGGTVGIEKLEGIMRARGAMK